MMRNAAHRQDDEAPPEPPARDLTAEAAALLDHARALLPVLKARGDDRAAMETVILGLRIAELASALEDAAAGEAVVAAAYAQGLVDGEAAARQARAPGPRHAGRKRHLSSVPGIPATAARTAAVAAVAAVALSGGVVAGMHDESAVRAFAASPFRHAALHRMAPDRASVVPSPRWSPSPRPSAAAASASPAPVVTAAVPSSSSPPAPAPSASPPPPAPPAPDLIVPSVLQLDGNRGTLTLTAGDQAVEWTLDASPGLSAGVRGGMLAAGQSVQVQVYDGPGVNGWLYVSWGQQVTAIEVTSSLAPAVALP